MAKRNSISREEQLAIEGREYFTGNKSERIATDRIQWPPPDELEDRFGPFPRLPRWVSALGELVAFSYEREGDDGELYEESVFEFDKPYPLLCSDFMSSNEGDESLYIIGGRYKADYEPDLICGNLIWVEYVSVKSFDDSQPTNYKHRFDSPWPIVAQSADRKQFYIFRDESEFYISRDGDVSPGIAG